MVVGSPGKERCGSSGGCNTSENAHARRASDYFGVVSCSWVIRMLTSVRLLLLLLLLVMMVMMKVPMRRDSVCDLVIGILTHFSFLLSSK